jgi:hypothetical protein
MTAYRDALGPIPDAAFENEAGPPAWPAFSAADLAAFDREDRGDLGN